MNTTNTILFCIVAAMCCACVKKGPKFPFLFIQLPWDR